MNKARLMNIVTPGQSRTVDAITHEQSLYLNTVIREYKRQNEQTSIEINCPIEHKTGHVLRQEIQQLVSRHQVTLADN